MANIGKCHMRGSDFEVEPRRGAQRRKLNGGRPIGSLEQRVVPNGPFTWPYGYLKMCAHSRAKIFYVFLILLFSPLCFMLFRTLLLLGFFS